MSPSPKITLYAPTSSLPRKETTSPYSRIVAYALAYRGIEFSYHPVSLREVQTFAPTLGAKPTITNPDGSPKYTLPVLVDATSPDASVTVADSLEILKYLQETYPDPAKPLFSTPSAPALEILASQSVFGIMFSIFQGILIKDAVTVIPNEDQDYFKNRILGGADPASMVLSKGSEGYIALVTKAKDELAKVAGLIAAQNGSWLGGEKPVYADFVLLIVLNSLKRLGGELWTEEFAKIDGGRFMKMYEAGEELYNKF
jgi:glutathione S-transferase